MNKEGAIIILTNTASFLRDGTRYFKPEHEKQFREAYEMAIKALEQPEQQWIPCSVRLPKQGQEVICQCRANIIKVLKLDADDDWYQDAEHCYMGGFVTAWMPLPEPYKVGEENR